MINLTDYYRNISRKSHKNLRIVGNEENKQASGWGDRQTDKCGFTNTFIICKSKTHKSDNLWKQTWCLFLSTLHIDTALRGQRNSQLLLYYSNILWRKGDSCQVYVTLKLYNNRPKIPNGRYDKNSPCEELGSSQLAGFLDYFWDYLITLLQTSRSLVGYVAQMAETNAHTESSRKDWLLCILHKFYVHNHVTK
jgi:hypothetical protein